MSDITYSSGKFTTKNGNQLFEQAWEVAEPTAAVAIVHGLGEHSSRYAHVAHHFNQSGFSVYGYDHLGHGQSEGQPRSYADSIDIWRDDCGQFLQRVRMKSGKLPLFVLAHSMGGLVFTYLAVSEMPKVEGVILSAAALAPGSDISPLLIRAAKVLGRVSPKLETQTLSSKFISRDSAEVQKYDSDPLVHRGGIPARTGAEMLRAMNVVRAGAPRINYPILVVHGTDDQIVNIDGSLQIHARVSSADKTLRLFDEGYHESHNEPNKAEVLQLYSDWIGERAAKSTGPSKSHHQKRAAARKGLPVNQDAVDS